MRTAGIIGLVFWSALALAADATYSLTVDGLACPFCAYGIEKQLRRIDGVLAVDVDVGAGRIRVSVAEGRRLTEAQARQAVRAAGFTLRGFAAEAAP